MSEVNRRQKSISKRVASFVLTGALFVGLFLPGITRAATSGQGENPAPDPTATIVGQSFAGAGAGVLGAGLGGFAGMLGGVGLAYATDNTAGWDGLGFMAGGALLGGLAGWLFGSSWAIHYVPGHERKPSYWRVFAGTILGGLAGGLSGIFLPEGAAFVLFGVGSLSGGVYAYWSAPQISTVQNAGIAAGEMTSWQPLVIKYRKLSRVEDPRGPARGEPYWGSQANFYF